MASAARAIRSELRSTKPVIQRREPLAPVQVQVPKSKPSDSDGTKVLLQPRLCNLRSYGSDRVGVIRTRRDGGDGVSPFFATLSEYIESSRKSHDFEIISGRLAMVSFRTVRCFCSLSNSKLMCYASFDAFELHADSFRGNRDNGAGDGKLVVQKDGCSRYCRGRWGVFGGNYLCCYFRMVLQCPN